ncbi:MAG TPA: NTP transferase domain-containing protein [Opitutales bacterium]|nr:NTP transferase domain-containing protein [Opitutales bacterium]
MKIGIFITARLKSTRLPRKVARELAGTSVLGHVIERAKQVRGVNDIVVCTSASTQDLPILNVCNSHFCSCFVGSPDDVLNRLLSAATLFECDYLLLITADNPLFSFEYAQRLVSEVEEHPDTDYLYIEGLPLGMDPYMVRREAFAVIDAIKNEEDTEFWPEYLKDRTVFRHQSIAASPEHRRDYRVTLDYPEDLAVFEAVYSNCFEGQPIPTSRVIDFLDANPSIRALNSSIERSWLSQERVHNIAAHLKIHRAELLSLKATIYDRDDG